MPGESEVIDSKTKNHLCLQSMTSDSGGMHHELPGYHEECTRLARREQLSDMAAGCMACVPPDPRVSKNLASWWRTSNVSSCWKNNMMPRLPVFIGLETHELLQHQATQPPLVSDFTLWLLCPPAVASGPARCGALGMSSLWKDF